MTGPMRRKAFARLEPLRRLIEGDLETARPRVEGFLDGSTTVVRAEPPGTDPDKDVEVTVVDDTLRVRATRQEKSEHQDKDRCRSEFHHGSFARILPMPKGCREDDTVTACTDGALEIRAPVREAGEQAGTKIPVTRRDPGTAQGVQALRWPRGVRPSAAPGVREEPIHHPTSRQHRRCTGGTP